MRKVIGHAIVSGGAARTLVSGNFAAEGLENAAALRKVMEADPAIPSANLENFRRIGEKAKTAVLGGILALYDCAECVDTETLAIVSINGDGCLQANVEYYRDFSENGAVMGRGSLFIGTLTTTPAAEVGIALRAHGEVFYCAGENAEAEIGRLAAKHVLVLEQEGDRTEVKLTAAADEPGLWCVVPFYDNASTITKVAEECRLRCRNVLLVDDGSGDLPPGFDAHMAELGVELLRHRRNRGKGAALISAAEFVAARGGRWMVTLDGDGQHDPADLPKLFEAIRRGGDDSMVIGVRDMTAENVPEKSRNGMKFGNMWFKIETGLSCPDCQSGFRAYPVRVFSKLHFFCRRYNFETEILTKCSWGKLVVSGVPIRIFYPPAAERVSHFSPWRDNLLISLIHAHLCMCRLLPWRPADLRVDAPPPIPSLFLKPVGFFGALLRENSSPARLAAAAAAASVCGLLPLIGFQVLTLLYLCMFFNLNRIMALAAHKLYLPPFTPFVCIEVGHYLQRGCFLTSLTLDEVRENWTDMLWSWALGGLALAPVAALVLGAVTWAAAALILRRERRSEANRG